jgi:8-oxo-dGTP pyrophosphatase MutT (NUDIX family)
MYGREVPADPRPAATVLLVRDDPFEVLMMRRRRGGTFSNALVFPGGKIENGDADAAWLPHLAGPIAVDEEQRALRVCAIRETFEEASVLLGVPPGTPAPALDRGLDFRAAVADAGIVLDLALLHPFARWITPELEPRRFDTHFFLCAMPDRQTAAQGDDESVALEWVSPGAVVARAEAGERSILFPTLMNLRRLAESPNVGSALAAAIEREVVPVRPVLEPHPDGFRITIDPAAGYGSGGHIIPNLMTGSVNSDD